MIVDNYIILIHKILQGLRVYSVKNYTSFIQIGHEDLFPIIPAFSNSTIFVLNNFEQNDVEYLWIWKLFNT